MRAGLGPGPFKFKLKIAMKVFFSVFLTALLALPLSADSFTLSLFQSTTDNFYQSVFAESDHVSNLRFFLSKDVGEVGLFAQGSYSHVYENAQLTYYTQDLGLDHVWPLGGKSALYLSFTGRGVFYRSDHSEFNYLALNAYGNLKSYLSQTSILKADYSLIFKGYQNDVYDYTSAAVNATVDKYLQSRTTLKAGLGWGYKFYLHPYSVDVPDTEVFDLQEPAMAMNRGKGSGKGSQSGQPPPGAGIPGPDQPSSGGQGISYLALDALVAQGLGEKVGLSLTARRQWPLFGQNPFSYVQEFYLVENPFYDRFSWVGFEGGLRLTILIPWDAQLHLGYTHSDKEFPGIEALDLDANLTGDIRRDQRDLWEIRMSKSLGSFDVTLNYAYMNNHSNDPFFAWDGSFFSLGLEWNTPWGKKQ